MREQLKALSKETLIYGSTTIVGRFLNFLLVPFYVNVLHTTSEYGIATSLYTYIGFLTVVYPLGLEAAFFRYGARAEGEPPQPEKEKKTFSSPFLFILLMAVPLTLLIQVLAPVLAFPIFHDPKSDITPLLPMLTTILRYGGFILVFDSLSVLPFAVLRLEHQAWRFASIRFSGIVLTLILNFLFVLGFHWGVEGIFLANLISSIVVFLMLLPTIAQRFVFHMDAEVLKKLLPFGLTNVPAALSSMMVQVIDRPIVQAYLGLGMLGVYQANYRMGVVMMILVGLFEYAWRPFFMRQSLKDDVQARLLFSRVFSYFMLISLLSFLALSWALPMIVSTKIFGIRLLKTPYLVGLPIIPVVLLAYVFQGMYTNFIAGIYIKEKNKKLPWITGLGAAVNILFNLWLIPRIGIMGAALATLFAYGVMALTLYKVVQKVYFVPYDWPRIRLLSGVVFGAFVLERVSFLFLSLVFGGMPVWGVVLMRTFMFGATLGVLALLDFFSEPENHVLPSAPMNTKETKKDFSAGGVVWDPLAKKYLLILVESLVGSRVWTFPKGHPETGETDEQAALREVLEETGWRCEVMKKLIDVHYVYTHDNVTFDKTVRWFLMKSHEEVGSFDPEEVVEVRWVTPAEAQSLISYGSDKELLKQTALLL